jgi:hypothetical protein
MREEIGILAKQLAYIEAIRQAEAATSGYPSDRKARASAILKDYLANFEKVQEIVARRGEDRG